jgi:OPT oligopeptide transporter protein
MLLAMLVAVLAVRALGETDLNPVSGIGKLTQLSFAVLAPGQVLPNLIAGAISEAAAMQAGDMMQDFKTAHLLGALSFLLSFCPCVWLTDGLRSSALSEIKLHDSLVSCQGIRERDV